MKKKSKNNSSGEKYLILDSERNVLVVIELEWREWYKLNTEELQEDIARIGTEGTCFLSICFEGCLVKDEYKAFTLNVDCYDGSGNDKGKMFLQFDQYETALIAYYKILDYTKKCIYFIDLKNYVEFVSKQALTYLLTGSKKVLKLNFKI